MSPTLDGGVIDSDQIAFLHVLFILNNILLGHESIQWAKESHQNSIFLEVVSNKAYDRVDWTFMFQVLEKLWIPSPFIHMIRLLFQDAYVFEISRLHMTLSFCSSSMHSLTRLQIFHFLWNFFSNFCKFNKRRKSCWNVAFRHPYLSIVRNLKPFIKLRPLC